MKQSSPQALGAVLLGLLAMTQATEPTAAMAHPAPIGFASATNGSRGLTMGSVSRGPYLQSLGPDRVTVRWRTPTASDSQVRIGSAPGSLGTIINDSTITTEHSVTVTGLVADTTYYYSIGDTSQVLVGDDANHFFRTAPVAGTPKPSRFWILGDCGTANSNQQAVRDAFLSFSAGAPADLMLLLGDNAYNSGTDTEYQAAIFDMYSDTLRNTGMWSTRGNHEQSSTVYYDIMEFPTAGEIGGVPSGTEAYYSFDYANVHFICLDSEGSNRTPTGAMATWLTADLAATLQPWIIAYWHHPPYTKGTHNSDSTSDSGGRMKDMREVFLPILEAGGVDLVFGGHSHTYERSFLIDGHYGDSSTFTSANLVDAGDGSEGGTGAYSKGKEAHQGAVYTVAGSSGKVGSGSLDHPAMFLSLSTLGSVVLDVNDTRLDIQFLSSTGSILDSYTMLTTVTGPSLRVTNLISGSQASFDISAAVPGDSVILAYSLTGAGPLPSPFGTVALTPPLTLLALGQADTNGDFSASVPVPPGITGLNLWVQALELAGLGAGDVSNPLAEVIQ